MTLITKPDFTYVWASGGAIVAPNDTKKQQGWVAEAPPFQYDNWLQNRQDQMLAHINQRGIPAWDGLTNYEAGGLSYVQGSDGKVYKSVAASGPVSVVQNPTTDITDTYWTVAFASTAQATETVQGIVELATTAEAQTGTDDARAMTALKVKQAIAQFGNDFINTTRIDVASSATVNLASSAPDTRHINITGTTTINGFTVTAGQCYFVRFNAPLTLVNSTSLVTQRGANILTAAGDTCIIRAVAANTVEVICGEFLVDRAIGSGQTLQDVVASRALTTNYTNTTGRTIFVSIGMVGTGTPAFDLMVDGLVASYSQTPGGPVNLNTLQAPVPNGSVYSVQLRGGTFSSIRSWLEIR